MEYLDVRNAKFLKIGRENVEMYINYINRNNISNVAVSSSWGYPRKEVDFLSECNNITGLIIVDSDIDLQGLSYCSGLSYLQSESAPNFKFDILLFQNLKELRCDYTSNWVNIGESKSIEILALWKFKKENLVEFERMENLKSLSLIKTKIKSLKGISRLRLLSDISISYAPDFLTIDDSSSSLIQFKIESAKRFSDYNSFSKLINLQSLTIINSNDIQDIQFVKEMHKLAQFSIEQTKIIDGDIEVLRNVPNLFFEDKKHYSFKLKEK